MVRRRWQWTIASIFIAIGIWNYPLTYRMGINGRLFEKRIPFYAKACGFLYRDWVYKDIVRDIVGKERDDTKKVLAILRWTNENISPRIPPGLKIVDDHPLNIIIRQYGAKDQVQDIFTILCSYGGMRGVRRICYSSDKKLSMWFCFIRVSGRWAIFDVVKSKYFLNKRGEIGGVEDYINGDLILSDQDMDTYGPFLSDLKNVDFSSFTRPDEQMPFRRLPVQFKKIFKYKNIR